MAGTDAYVQGPPDSTGKKIDNDVLAIGADQVYRQRIRLAGAAATELADVRNADPAAGDYGGVVRLAGTVPLPTGASTTARQDTGNSSLSSVDGKLPALAGGRVPVDASGVAVPVTDNGGSLTVDATSLPLPTGAALEAGGNLAAIKTDVDKIPADPAREGGNLATLVAGLLLAQASSSASATGPMVMAAVDDGPAVYTVGELRPLRQTAGGRLRVSSSESLDAVAWGDEMGGSWNEARDGGWLHHGAW